MTLCSYRKDIGNSFMMSHIGHMDTDDDLNSWTPSVFENKVKFPCNKTLTSTPVSYYAMATSFQYLGREIF